MYITWSVGRGAIPGVSRSFRAETVQSVSSSRQERDSGTHTLVCKEDGDSHSDSIESRERGRLAAGSTLPRAAAASERASGVRNYGLNYGYDLGVTI